MNTCNLLAPALLLSGMVAAAPETTPQHPLEDKVVVTGAVADEATRAALIGRLQQLYGSDRVVDSLEVGGVVAAPDWTRHLTAALSESIRQVRDGELRVTGSRVALEGRVANESQRQQVASDIATALDPTYTVTNSLRVAAPPQTQIDDALADRVVEFDAGATTLTARGTEVLDQLAGLLAKLEHPPLQIVGHTDSSGARLANIGLSLARADRVKSYLQSRGVPAQRMTALGAGPDHPVASNATAEGRARNRRIEFRILD